MDYFYILAFDITAFAQTLSEQFQARLSSYHRAYAGNFCWLLRFGSKAKRKEYRAERNTKDVRFFSVACCLAPVASVHLITLSARMSTIAGIVNPRALAALRLITSSNSVGCSTGRSAGLVPFRILST